MQTSTLFHSSCSQKLKERVVWSTSSYSVTRSKAIHSLIHGMDQHKWKPNKQTRGRSGRIWLDFSKLFDSWTWKKNLKNKIKPEKNKENWNESSQSKKSNGKERGFVSGAEQKVKVQVEVVDVWWTFRIIHLRPFSDGSIRQSTWHLWSSTEFVLVCLEANVGFSYGENRWNVYIQTYTHTICRNDPITNFQENEQ